jgi:hypothetical protein
MPDDHLTSSASLSAEARPRRRWYQFGLRTLFVLTTGIIGLLLLWRIYIEPYRRQREAMEVIKQLGGTFETTEAATWQRRLFGKDFQNITRVDLAYCDDVDEYFRHIAVLPHLERLTVGGANFGDEHLSRLDLPSLQQLVLDSTRETRAGIGDFQRRQRNVEVSRSDRRAIEALVLAGFQVASTGPQLNPKITALRLPTSRAVGVLQSDFDQALISLRCCRQVLSLDLRAAPVTDAGLQCLAVLENLQRLELASTRVTDDGMQHVTRLTELVTLGLENTSVTDAGIRRLEPLRRLENLRLLRTPVTVDGLKWLANTLPRCTIFGANGECVSPSPKS